MNTKINHTVVGIAVVLGFLAIMGGFLWFSNMKQSDSFEPYHIFFHSSVAGLSEGSPVKYKGILVGRVQKIQLDSGNEGAILVSVEISRSLVVSEGMTASLEMAGITGEVFVQISGAPGGKPLRPTKENKIPSIPASNSSLERIFKTTPELLMHADTLLLRLLDVMTVKNQKNFSTLLENSAALTGKATKTMEHMDVILEMIQKEGVGALLSVSAKVSESLKKLDDFLDTTRDMLRPLLPTTTAKRYVLK